MTLDCDGHTVSPGQSRAEDGIRSEQRSGITITNCTVEGFPVTGIMLLDTRDSNVSSNSTLDNAEGISLVGGSTGNTISGNSSDRNTFDGYLIQDSTDNELVDNQATGNAANFSLERADSNRLTNNLASGGGKGYEVVAGQGNVFEQNGAVGGSLGMSDTTSGAGTAGTANQYADNKCTSAAQALSEPAGLCTQ